MINELDALEKDPHANPRELGKLQLKLESQGIPTDEMGRKQYINGLQFSNEALGPFALANTFAGFLLVSLVLAGELFRTLQGPRSKAMLAAWAAALVLLLYCLILTKSRTAWTGLLVAGGCVGPDDLGEKSPADHAAGLAFAGVGKRRRADPLPELIKYTCRRAETGRK